MANITSRKKKIISIGIIAAISLATYIAHSHYYYEIGFPLDDSWIHQTYARNLVELGEWSFIPGKPSSGSTSPLWIILLTPAYFLNISPIVWTNILGWLLLWGIGIMSMMLFEQYNPRKKRYSIWVGIGMVCEWHLIWAAGSGMETLLFALILLIPFLDISHHRYTWFINGLLVGVTIWIRPDGIILFLPIFLFIWIKETIIKKKIISMISCFVGVLLLFIPYLMFNQTLSGDWWPNTFYAKQTEYAVLRESSLILRYLRQFMLPLVGVGVLLLPGFIMFCIGIIRNRKWQNIPPVVMFLCYLGAYAWRLPVTYQHGRYIIPVMPLFFIMGISGLVEYYHVGLAKMITRVLYKSWIISSAAILIGFFILGAQAYAKDVGFIQSEMVATAKWIQNNTEPEAIIAAHDIGALGYWGKREILDLAGLITPEVIPFIRDEHRIQKYLDDHQTDYLMTFPNWYPYLSSIGDEVYRTGGKISILLGGENMVVYKWNSFP